MSWNRLVLTSQIAAPGVDTDVLTAARILVDEFESTNDLQQPAKYGGWTWRINICCAAASIVKLVDDTGDEIHLNGGSALTAKQNLVEDFIPDPTRTYNLQLDTTDGEIYHLAILLVSGEAV